ncbi:MAG: hypothetical protein JST84_04420 [Acidobacteria bacterium]|nr:hypothetical protein [Acidobacteriota bacterium]
MIVEQPDLRVNVYSHLDRIGNELRALHERLDHGEAVSIGQLEELKRLLSSIGSKESSNVLPIPDRESLAW